MTVIAVTGADGFIGTHLCSQIEGAGREVIRIVRRASNDSMSARVVADITDRRGLALALEGADVVVHLAARAHVIRDRVADPESEFRRVNVDGVAALCWAASNAGVRRLVFLSSIGVNGSVTGGKPFDEADPPRPVEPYAVSKWCAEQMLATMAPGLNLETVIVRPPLVYGVGVKGNFLRLLDLASSGLPLPLASIENRRSLIGVRNLCDLLLLCAEAEAAAGRTYVAAEPEVHSTPDLLRALARGLCRPCRLFKLPPTLLRTSMTVAGFRAEYQKLCASLEVCADRVRDELGWKPMFGFEEEIERTAQWYRSRGRDGA